MNSILERLMGVDTLTDQVIAMDMLSAAKLGIKLYAVAATEAATPEVRETFIRHLYEAIDTHASLLEHMTARGFYHPYDVQAQLRLDRANAEAALNIPS